MKALFRPDASNPAPVDVINDAGHSALDPAPLLDDSCGPDTPCPGGACCSHEAIIRHFALLLNPKLVSESY
ncbi:hypothetical protein H4R33_003103 [Dimargaris cristalligena]|nr:hypothetical protein H4R33_003103 [Dimargaris cristalligena]